MRSVSLLLILAYFYFFYLYPLRELHQNAITSLRIYCGWHIDTRCLLISLPEDKFIAWCRDIERLLAVPKVTAKELEVTIGRLNHVGFIIPLARHFLSRRRMALYAAQHRCHTSLRPAQLADLCLWLRFLWHAHAGINLNLLTFPLANSYPME